MTIAYINPSALPKFCLKIYIDKYLLAVIYTNGLMHLYHFILVYFLSTINACLIIMCKQLTCRRFQDMWLFMWVFDVIYCDVTIAQLFDGPFDCDVIMKKSANMCDVGPLANRQLGSGKMKHDFLIISRVKIRCEVLFIDIATVSVNVYLR